MLGRTDPPAQARTSVIFKNLSPTSIIHLIFDKIQSLKISRALSFFSLDHAESKLCGFETLWYSHQPPRKTEMSHQSGKFWQGLKFKKNKISNFDALIQLGFVKGSKMAMNKNFNSQFTSPSWFLFTESCPEGPRGMFTPTLKLQKPCWDLHTSLRKPRLR